jgi:hypothetical protein
MTAAKISSDAKCEFQSSGSMTSEIVWVASYPRSGSTWIRMFLFNVSQIMAGHDKEQNINSLSGFSPWDGENDHYAKYLDTQSLAAAIPQNRAEAVAKLKTIASVRQHWQRDLCNTRVGPTFVKTHWLLEPAFGHGSFDFARSRKGIYCVRNPLDVAVSLAAFVNQPMDSIVRLLGQVGAFIAAEKATDYFGSWSEHVVSWSQQNDLDVCIVRYEDLLGDPDLWFSVISRRVFTPPPTREQVQAAIHRSTFDLLKSQEQKYGFLEMPGGRFFRAGRAGEWRESLESRHAAQIAHDHKRWMAHFGY